MERLIVDMLSDTHGKQGFFDTAGGDILLHSGDFTSRGTDLEIEMFMTWFADQDYSHKVAIPGNHDWGIEKNPEYWKEKFLKNGIHLLNDSGVILKDMRGSYNIKVWGSPVTPWFHSWAFNRARTEQDATRIHPWIKPHWDMIPKDTEILLTHGPAYKILDEVDYKGSNLELNVGCEELAKRILETDVKLHVSGHIHEARGFEYKEKCTYVNASSLDRMYSPADRKPMRAYREVVLDGTVIYVL